MKRREWIYRKTTAKRLAAAVLIAAFAFGLTACGSEKEDAAQSGDSGAKIITFAYRNSGNWPIAGEDENGNPAGYDIDTLKLVDEKLQDYDFRYVGTSYDDAYIGLEAGNYDAALTNAFWTEERAEKYLIPDEALGASVLVLAVRKENADVKNLEDVSKNQLKLAPLLAGNGMYYFVKQYNEDHPDEQVEITTTDDSTNVAGSVEELAAGKYDAIIYTKPQWDTTVVAEDGANHSYLDQVSYAEFDTANTYPMFSKNVGEDFLKEFNDALKSVKDSGDASKVSEKYFGYDIFNYEFQ